MLGYIFWPFLFILSLLFGLIVTVRNQFYKIGIFKSYNVNCPVVSVGNLTTGGTGKTPVILDLIDLAQSRGMRPAVVSRGYGSVDRHPRRAELSENEPADAYGDEPTMIAKKNPEVPVFVGVNKVEVCELAIADTGPDLILADDAFQHLRLKRDIDIVLIDASKSDDELKMLPLGRAREPLSSLKRADYIILSKTNFAKPNSLLSLRERVMRSVSKSCQVFLCETVVTDLISFTSTDLVGEEHVDRRKQTLAALSDQRRTPVLLCSGIGNPQFFEKLVEADPRFEIIDHLVFPDHHDYKTEDISKISSLFASSSAELLLTTEKDAVKLSRWPDAMKNSFFVEIGLKWFDFRGTEISRKKLSEIFSSIRS